MNAQTRSDGAPYGADHVVRLGKHRFVTDHALSDLLVEFCSVQSIPLGIYLTVIEYQIQLFHADVAGLHASEGMIGDAE